MFRKIVSAAAAFSIAFAPLVASAREETFMFRYTSGLRTDSRVPEVPSEPEEYGVGNDITAYYVAPTGYDFSKKIPVATQDVVAWKKDSGDLPSGISLDESSGQMSGRPTVEGTQSLLYRGWDAGGNRIARAALNFTVFTPVGAGRELAFYGHTGTYFYQTVPLPDGVDIYRWDPIIEIPEGMSMEGLAFQGTPEKAGTYAIAWRGYNYVGREVAFAWGEFLVEDGPKIEYIENQTVAKGESQVFDVRPVVKHSLGTLVYTLVPEEGRPAGLRFDPETGHLYGLYPTYNTSGRFHIDVIDSGDGQTSSSNTFTLATLPQDIDLCCVNNLEATVNDPFSQKISTSVSDGEFQILQGQLPNGLQLGSKNGYIYGTPKKVETQDGIVIGVSGNGVFADQSQPFKFTVFPEAIVADIKPVHARVGDSFATTAPVVNKGNVSPLAYSVIEGATMDDRLHLDAATGVISSEGISEAGTFDVTLSIRNGDGQTSKPVIQPISIHEPLSVSYASMTVKRLQTLKVDPVINRDAVVGTARFSVDGHIPPWMTFDLRTGRLSGTPVYTSEERIWGPYTVTLSDDTRDMQSSEPFTVTVAPRDQIEVGIVNDVVERFVANQKPTAEALNTFGNVTYSLSSGTLGGTLKITDSGVLVGATQDPVGTVYSGLEVTARDEDDIFGRPSAPFTITVVEPSDPKPLHGSFDISEEWVAGIPFSFPLPELANGYGTVTYALDAPANGVLIDSAERTVSGVIAEPGTYTFPYTARDEIQGREPATGTITIVVKEPMTVTMEEVYQANVGSVINIVPSVINQVGEVSYQLQGVLPPGLQYKDGRIGKAPTQEGLSDVLTLVVKDEAETTVVKQFRIDVGPALPFSVSWKSGLLRVGSTAGLPINASPISALGKMSYSLISGVPPIGMDFVNGAFVGAPREAGTFKLVIDATDGGPDEADAADDRTISVEVELKVAPANDISFVKTAYTVRKDRQFTLPIEVKDGVGALTFEAGSSEVVPYDIVLGPSGTLTGTLAEAKSYEGIAVRVKDELDRTAEATLTVTAVDALAASIPSTVDFKQYSESSSAVTAVNPAGTLSFEWAADSPAPPTGLTLDRTTGVISGSPEVFGDFPGFRIVVTDDFDGTTAETQDFAIRIAERDPLVLTPPTTLTLKRYSIVNASATVASAVGAVTYEVAPDLPTGIDLDASTGEISGSSDEVVPTTAYTLTATDEKAGELGTDVKTFTLEVAERDPLEIVVADALVFKQHAEESKGATAKDPIGTVQWAISPALPEGLTFADGKISGVSHEVVPPTGHKITAVDAKGGDLGSDEAMVTVSVEARDPLVPDVPASYKFNQFFEGGFGATVANVLGAASWTFEPELPEWMIATVDAASGDLKIKGTPQEFMDPTEFVLTVEDDYDVADPQTVSISVGERRTLKIETSAAEGQPIVLAGLIGYPFTTKLAAVDARGALTWTFVSGTLPSGVSFDETKGAFSGVVSEYGTFPGISISVADEKGGFDQRTFTLEIGQDGSAITISSTNPPNIHLGQSVTTPAPEVNNVVGDATFSATGLAGTGLSVDPATGIISGTPKVEGTIAAQVSVSDITQRIPEAPATVVITVLPAITVEAVSETELVYNYEPAAVLPLAKDSVPANVWSLKSGALPKGVSIDPSTGTFIGKPEEVGTFGPVVLAVKDSLGGTGVSDPISVKVKMNDDPIELAVGDMTTHVGFEFQTAVPVYDNELGTVTFFSPDAVAQGLSIDPATGIVSGRIDEVRDVIINVSVRDSGTLRVTSQPLKLQILPQVEVVLPSQVALLALEQMAEVKPTVQYAVGEIVWNEVSDPSSLPPGVSFDKSTGSFKGMPTELGTYGPVTVTGTDAVGGTGSSDPIAFEVRPGAKFIGLADAALPGAVKRSEYSFDFSTLATTVGFEAADLQWKIVADSSSAPPAGLVASGSVLAGIPDSSGTFSVVVTIKPTDPQSTIPAVTKTYQLVVTIPQTSISLPASLPDGDAVVAYSYDFKSSTVLQNLDMSALSWELVLDRDPSTLPEGVTNSLPDGMTLNATQGLLSGTPKKGGTYVFSVKARFMDSEEDVSDQREYTIVISGASFGFKVISSGNGTGTCGITTDERLACWGSNGWGQAGDGTTDLYKRAPVYVAGLEGVKSVAVGSNSACAVTATGKVMCWGYNGSGQLGNGTNDSSALPVKVVGIDTATTVVGFNAHYCAGLAEGGVKCWGAGTNLQLGNGLKGNSNVPVDVAGISGVVRQFATTAYNSCAVLSDDTVWCWGGDADESLGNGTGINHQPAPVQVAGLLATSIAGGFGHYCVTTTAGEAKCWGRGNNYQLGPGTVDDNTNKAVPTLVSGLSSGVRSIGVGYLHSCAVLDTGAAKCWGYDNMGQQGDGAASSGGAAPPYGNNIGPTQVVGLTSGVASIAGGNGHTCAVMTDGMGKCWGNGQALGDGVNLTSAVPVDVGTK